MPNLRSLLVGGVDLQSRLANAAWCLLRLGTGLAMAFNHGIGKIPPSERFIERVGSLGFPIPEFFAYAAGVAEFFGGLLLAIGLLTRPSAFFILIVMIVAVFIRHAADPFGGSKELASLYGAVCVAFLLIGSGRFGVDAMLRRKRS